MRLFTLILETTQSIEQFLLSYFGKLFLTFRACFISIGLNKIAISNCIIELAEILLFHVDIDIYFKVIAKQK